MTKLLSRYNQENEEMVLLPEEEKQESLFEVLQEGMVVMEGLLFCKHPKMKIHYKHIDTNQNSKQSHENHEDQKNNMVPMQRI